ncbi:LANO_0E00430g1_1 [Lachancea nothofagi CBS 11611]|uniref:LANO_0E00430g1_1 n=1 Tax=Lachancea nothofagi CBS 11611 TaxID=1266666 RepID=A0A1G4JNX4_9SACH|nr:LANO_0E00430g1_1 [Lachancea nothofagi CBS 11611]
MKLLTSAYGIVNLLALSAIGLSRQVPKKDHSTREYFAVESTLPLFKLLALYPNWTFEHEARGLENHYVFSTDIDQKLKREDINVMMAGIASFHALPPKRLNKRMPVPKEPTDSSLKPLQDARDHLSIEDPLFDRQWHLINTNHPGNDVNVTGLWYENITGHNVVAAIVDDGLDYESEDLKDNFSAEGSWDFNDNNPLPKPRLADDYHGTRCAGEIAAVKNKACGIGVAYDAKVAGIRILSGDITSEDEAASLTHALDVNDIYSCSWGPSDDGRTLQGPDELVKKALVTGTMKGRNEKGALYVFASGNGGMYEDNCNFDGYTNSIYSITVGAIDHKGLHPPYSESCSAVMVVTYSSGSGEHIHSTDIHGGCSDTHGGTSAAAPLAAGVYSLVLDANPNLTWRDVQYLSILSSVEINSNDGNWQMGALGRSYSHKYGYGKLDAYNIVDMARTWENVGPQSWHYLPTQEVESSTKQTEETLESSVRITSEQLRNSNFKRVEHITVTVSIGTTNRGQTTVDLISPSGMISNLGVTRRNDNSQEGFDNWTFMSVAHWGESGEGEWKLKVSTTQETNTVTLKNWRLKLFGESLEPSRAEKFEYGNDNENETTESSSTSLSTQAPSSTATESAKPTGDPPTATESAAAKITATPTDDTSEVNKPNRLPPPFDGMRYFLAIFVVGAVALLLYFLFFVRSRRLIRRSRAETYEFDIIDTDSENDSSLNATSNPNAELLNERHADDFDFDLSDEELLRSNSGSPKPAQDSAIGGAPSNIDEVLKNPFEDGAPAVKDGGNTLDRESSSK